MKCKKKKKQQKEHTKTKKKTKFIAKWLLTYSLFSECLSIEPNLDVITSNKRELNGIEISETKMKKMRELFVFDINGKRANFQLKN